MTGFMRVLLGVTALFVISLPAHAAATYKEKDAAKFIGSMDDINVFLGKMEQEGKDEVLELGAPKPGENLFAPYSRGVSALKEKFPADHKDLAGIVKKHGFSNVDDWAKIGDSVMLSYLAVKMTDENPQAAEAIKNMENMTPEMIAMMPPEMKAQFEQTKVLMKTVSAVSPEDKALVKPHVPVIDAWAQAEAKKVAPQ